MTNVSMIHFLICILCLKPSLASFHGPSGNLFGQNPFQLISHFQEIPFAHSGPHNEFHQISSPSGPIPFAHSGPHNEFHQISSPSGPIFSPIHQFPYPTIQPPHNDPGPRQFGLPLFPHGPQFPHFGPPLFQPDSAQTSFSAPFHLHLPPKKQVDVLNTHQRHLIKHPSGEHTELGKERIQKRISSYNKGKQLGGRWREFIKEKKFGQRHHKLAYPIYEDYHGYSELNAYGRRLKGNVVDDLPKSVDNADDGDDYNDDNNDYAWDRDWNRSDVFNIDESVNSDEHVKQSRNKRDPKYKQKSKRKRIGYKVSQNDRKYLASLRNDDWSAQVGQSSLKKRRFTHRTPRDTQLNTMYTNRHKPIDDYEIIEEEYIVDELVDTKSDKLAVIDENGEPIFVYPKNHRHRVTRRQKHPKFKYASI